MILLAVLVSSGNITSEFDFRQCSIVLINGLHLVASFCQGIEVLVTEEYSMGQRQ